MAFAPYSAAELAELRDAAMRSDPGPVMGRLLATLAAVEAERREQVAEKAEALTQLSEARDELAILRRLHTDDLKTIAGQVSTNNILAKSYSEMAGELNRTKADLAALRQAAAAVADELEDLDGDVSVACDFCHTLATWENGLHYACDAHKAELDDEYESQALSYATPLQQLRARLKVGA